MIPFCLLTSQSSSFLCLLIHRERERERERERAMEACHPFSMQLSKLLSIALLSPTLEAPLPPHLFCSAPHSSPSPALSWPPLPPGLTPLLMAALILIASPPTGRSSAGSSSLGLPYPPADGDLLTCSKPCTRRMEPPPVKLLLLPPLGGGFVLHIVQPPTPATPGCSNLIQIAPPLKMAPPFMQRCSSY
ncbi:hypothetical protein GOP47_0025235 [Adiantum capillus-veneris]|uniref:Uncharacterized protein n=1 Tax=Adiantum capillus-veneris TaxID=13818 RepID=A0A9D4U3R9_ADICA|nr:hypothetical protein GOP47_0025235 [Adiantum capillus-veneris]